MACLESPYILLSIVDLIKPNQHLAPSHILSTWSGCLKAASANVVPNSTAIAFFQPAASPHATDALASDSQPISPHPRAELIHTLGKQSAP